MKFWQRIVAWLKSPHGWQLALLYVVTFAAAVCAMILSVGNFGGFWSVAAYFAYALAALLLGFSVYSLVKIAPKIKQKALSTLQKRAFTNKMLQQYGFRTIVFSTASFTINLAYVALNGVVAIIDGSVWYGSLAAYYLLLAVMRGGAISVFWGKKRNTPQNSVLVYKRCGIGLIVLPMALSVAILQMVRGENSFEHAGMMIYVSATYAFYKIIMSVVNVFKARKTDDFTVRAVRCINLSDAMVSILALQTAMFKEFGGEEIASGMNTVTGTAVCALTVALGIFMVAEANKKIKSVERNNESERTK
ncbi:MAG: hypothetical protein ACI4QL_00860 [Candidatus Fimimonas sp.]